MLGDSFKEKLCSCRKFLDGGVLPEDLNRYWGDRPQCCLRCATPVKLRPVPSAKGTGGEVEKVWQQYARLPSISCAHGVSGAIAPRSSFLSPHAGIIWWSGLQRYLRVEGRSASDLRKSFCRMLRIWGQCATFFANTWVPARNFARVKLLRLGKWRKDSSLAEKGKFAKLLAIVDQTLRRSHFGVR